MIRIAVEPLLVALEDADDCLCRRVVRALGQIGGVRAVELLIAALGDEDRHVQSYAAKALVRESDQRGGAPKSAAPPSWLNPMQCGYLHAFREEGLSDRPPIEACFEPCTV